MPEPLRYDIRVNADTSGAPKAEAAIKGVTAASNEANAAASAHAAGAAQMWSGLQQAAQGGANTIVGLGRAIGGAFQAAMGAVPIAKWIAMAAQLVGVLGTVVGAVGLFRREADATKPPVDALTTAQDAAKRSAEALAKSYSDNLTSALKAIATDAAAAIEWAHKLAAANEEVAKSIDNKTKAEITLKKEQGKISEAQAATQLAGVDASAAARQAKGRLDAIRIERDVMQQALDRASSVAETPRSALETLLAQRSDAQARQRAAVTAELEYKSTGAAAYSYKNAFGVPWMEVGASGGTPEQVAAFEAAKTRFESAARAVAETRATAPDEGTMKDLDAALAQAWKDWEQASAPVQELKKKTEELTKTLDLRTKTEQTVLQNNTAADAAKNTPAISDEQKAKNEAARKAAEDRKVATYQQLGSAVLAESSATGTRQLDAEIWKRAFPNKPFPQSAQPIAPSLTTPTTPAAATTPGLGVVPAGTALPAWQQSPNAAMQLGGGRLPSDLARTGLPGGITAGPSAGGDDNKTAKAIDGATGAMKEMPTGEGTSKSAEELKAATEQAAQAQKTAGEATVQALTESTAAQQQAAAAVAETQSATVAKLGEVVVAQQSLRSEMRSLAAQVRAMRVA